MTSRTCLTALVLLTISSTLAFNEDDKDTNTLKVNGLNMFIALLLLTHLGLTAVFLSCWVLQLVLSHINTD